MGEPVTSWETDFDIGDPRYETDPYTIWDELRLTCPVPHTDRRGGAFLTTRYEDVVAVARDVETFSSRDVGVLPTKDGASLLVAPPITSDPPFHTEARQILLRYFSPKVIQLLEDKTRAICTELLDALAERDTADAAAEYAQHIPVRIIAHMLGIPEEDEDRFTGWAIRLFQESSQDTDVNAATIREVLAYFDEQVTSRREERADDLISALIDTELGGAPLTHKHLLGTCFLLLLAGIDTTWSGIGASLWHLAAHPADRDRLVAEPELIPSAVEEFLRAYSPVTMARVATADSEVAGCPIHRGAKVYLSFAAANRDPEVFDRADEVVLDRQQNRHLAFGVGIHRCLGSNLARMEMRVAIQTWLDRYPGFALEEAAEVKWSGAQVRGPRAVPVRLT